MFRARILVALALASVVPCAWASPHAGRHAEPAIVSTGAIVADATDSTVLWKRRADAVRPIASITKLMTALVVLEAGQPLDERIAITTEDARATSKSSSRLAVGTRLTRAQLLQLALMSSENRAAQALARTYPGGLPAALAAMRRKAAALGMTRTRFEDPTGLSPGNVATPAELIRLVRAASAEPLIREYSTARSMVVSVGRRPLEFRNSDRLAHDPSWNLAVSKTGYIQEAGRCLVLETVVADRPYVIVLLDSRRRVADARVVRQWLERRLAAANVP